jgi:NAD(P) transhydrogenase
VAYDFDLVVIGSGPAGEKAAAQAAYFGKRVAVIEKEPLPGGAAVHTGTLPSKTLRETAVFLAGHRQRELYGLGVTVAPELAVQKLLARKDAVRDREVNRVLWNFSRHGIETFQGTARLIDGHSVAVAGESGTRVVSGEFILVATGSVPHHPEGIDFPDPAIDDSDEVLGIERLPKKFIILGGGVIGCEYACMFAELGVEVALVEPRPRLLPFIDSEICEALEASMRERGVTLHLGRHWTSVARWGTELAVGLDDGAEIRADRVLVASGRSGATDGLGLEDAGVKLGQRGTIEVDAHYRTNVLSVFAAGDVIGFPALASTSMEQGRLAVCHAFGFDYRHDLSGVWPSGIYTIPEVSCSGLTEEQAVEKGLDAVCGRATYDLNARGQIIGASGGMVKLVFDRETRRLVGTHIIGDSATEIIHIGQAVMALDGTVDALIDMVFNYPTLSECYKYAAYDALGRWDNQAGASR